MNLRMFCIYSGEVGNGGHIQFFLNPGGCYAGRVLVALHEMALGRLENILRRAIEVFPGGRVPPDEDERKGLIEQFPGEALETLDHLRPSGLVTVRVH